MTKTLRARHAEQIGGRVIEPGQPIPADADADELAALDARGLVHDDGKSTKSSKTSSKES